MSIEIKTANIEPVRNTFSNIAKRFGDKPATRYQEATYDVQATTNFHYRPLWQPDKTLNDKSHTAITMADWYVFRDPRQFYYGAYVQKRAKMQESAEHNYAFFEKRKLAGYLSDDLKQALTVGLLPLRHVEQTANLNFMSGSAYGYGTTLTQACLYAGMDRLGIAQYVSRIGLLLDGNSSESLTQAKQQWMDNPLWQPMRALCEAMLVQQDYFEVLVAQGLLMDTYTRVIFGEAFDAWLNDQNGRDLAMLTEFMQDTLKEQGGWADSVYKTAAAENDANADLLRGWVEQWQTKIAAAYAPIIAYFYSDSAEAVQAQIQTELDKRLKKAGLH